MNFFALTSAISTFLLGWLWYKQDKQFVAIVWFLNAAAGLIGFVLSIIRTVEG